MRLVTQLPMRLVPRVANAPSYIRPLHSTVAKLANVAPIVGTGPPPEPPLPAEVNAHQRVARRKKQAEMLKRARELRSSKSAKKDLPLKKRFWKEVTIKEVDGALQIYLDARPLRHPNTKEIIHIPMSKPDLACSLAIEWDQLTSAQDATRQHLIPLTGLVCRALDIAADDATDGPEHSKIRTAITNTVLRYLDTDSILCWAPPAGENDVRNDAGESLRDVQKRVAKETVSFLTTYAWPGIQIEPVLDGHSIMPRQQNEGVREVVQGWIMGLDAWEIAGLERAALAGKSLIAAARFVTEWSEGPVGLGHLNNGKRFGVEEAASATSLEVEWQTGYWGLVEDTHDVNREDVRRQLGSVVLLVSGTGSRP